MSSDRRRSLIVMLALAGPGVLLGLGCGLVEYLRGPSRPSFSHARHVGEKKMECADCHSDYETGEAAGMPVPETCAPCHGEKDAAKPPLERVEAFLVNGEPAWSRVTALSEEVTFSHQVHHEKGVACAECHRGIETSTRISSGLAIGKRECMDCHARKASNECSVCHKVLRRETAPPDHQLNWLRLHGQAVRSGREERDLCSLCHSESQCADCHRQTAPVNHTEFWRQRGHGVVVSIDRDSCRTCHQVDFCDRCHRETAPRNHVGSFGSTMNRHCLSCHIPLRDESCFVCHKSTPSHQSAPPKPDWHTPAMNCRQCHVPGPLLRHVDNGDNCNGCHR